jgi:hypothetical protein
MDWCRGAVSFAMSISLSRIPWMGLVQPACVRSADGRRSIKYALQPFV